jgi:O-antigen/teichoic acid export membrane protein
VNIIPSFIRRRIAQRPNLVKIVDNIGWLFLDKIVRMGIGLLVGVWVARYLGPQQFGLLNFATAYVSVFGIVAGLGLQAIVVRDVVLNSTGKEETLGTAAALQLAGGLVAYFIAIIGIFWLRPEDQTSKILVTILGLITLLKASEVASYWFEAQVLSRYTVWVQNIVFLAFAIIKVILILQQASVIVFAWAALGEALVVAFLMLIMLGLRGPHLRQLRVSMKRAKALLSDAWPLLLTGMSIMIYMKIDQIMLGQMVGDKAVGLYSAALRISEIWYFIPMAIVASVFPAVLDAKQRSEALYHKRLQQIYDLMVFLSLAIAIPMTFLSTPLVNLLFGHDYTQAGQILAIHIWATVFVFLGVASSQSFVAERRQILSLQRTVLGAIINVALNVCLIPSHGPIGAAWATVIAQFSVGILFDGFQKETHGMFRMKLRAFNPQRMFYLVKGYRS